MAGMAGFEPTHDGVKVRCLTAWRHPNDVALFDLLKVGWLGWQDSNLRMTESKSVALPLGDIPTT